MNNNSLEAYLNPKNQKKFNSQRAMIFRFLLDNPNQSRFACGRAIGIDPYAAQKRLSELYNNNDIFISGNRKHGENTISLYSVEKQYIMFPTVKKIGLKNWLVKNHPDIFKEYLKSNYETI